MVLYNSSVVSQVFNVRSTQRLTPGKGPTTKLDPLGFPLTPGNQTPSDPKAGTGASALTTQAGLLSVAVTNVQAQQTPPAAARAVDEQADSAVRKAVLYFGPSGHNPRLFIGFRYVLGYVIAPEFLISNLLISGTKSTSMLVGALKSSTRWKTIAQASVSQHGMRFTSTPRSFARSTSKSLSSAPLPRVEVLH